MKIEGNSIRSKITDITVLLAIKFIFFTVENGSDRPVIVKLFALADVVR